MTQLPRLGPLQNRVKSNWSWKRGLRYGTLICDLESKKPIDVLADRSVQTVSAWFEQRPSVEIVSRDRSSEYAAAISKGAPQAIQVADSWHIYKEFSRECANAARSLSSRNPTWCTRADHTRASARREGTRAGEQARASSTFT